MKTAVAERQQPPPPAPVIANDSAALIQIISTAARDPSVDVNKMEKLMAMHERLTEREAEKAFNVAMTACQLEMKAVSTDATNPQTKSEYATYAKLDSYLRPIYTKHGFALSFDEGESKPDMVRVECIVSHVSGHSRKYHRDIPADGKGAKGGDVMTKTHAAGAAGSYGARYLLKGIFNVAIGDADNDGNGDQAKGMTEADYQAFVKRIEACTSKDKAKLVWREGITVCEKLGDKGSAEALKAVLLKHGKFIDSASKE